MLDEVLIGLNTTSEHGCAKVQMGTAVIDSELRGLKSNTGLPESFADVVKKLIVRTTPLSDSTRTVSDHYQLSARSFVDTVSRSPFSKLFHAR